MTDREVSALIEEFRTPLHVRRHCAAVATFAVELGRKLVAAGEKINLDLLRHAALLHDFVRVVDFREFRPGNFPDPVSPEDIAFWTEFRKKNAGRGHEELGAEILALRGFSDVAEVIKKHRFLQIEKGFDTWEEKLLYYADKRTKHDKIVPLAERLEDGRKRNMPEYSNSEAQRKLEERVFLLEKDIFSNIPS